MRHRNTWDAGCIRRGNIWDKEYMRRKIHEMRNKVGMHSFFPQMVFSMQAQYEWISNKLLGQLLANSFNKSQKSRKKHGRSYWSRGSNWQSGQKNRSNNTPATRINTVAQKSKQTDLSKVIYYNCQNKGHYANACLDPLEAKNLYGSWPPPRW